MEKTTKELQAEVKRLKHALETIQSIGSKAIQGHGNDCPCATCLLTHKAEQSLIKEHTS